ncbi:Uncharacterised protein [Mycobacterium tuberculosis]|nr:Uncharacterised protein [Mycobacterium tuberculosis]CKQ88850.1 Uncharacterised protein [Mycobacterium tuberculosis]CKU23990.1 Uncharacterised protein [Mycobacterium tuberculosis]
MVNENAEPTPRAGPELGDDLHQVVDATEMFDDDTFDSQVRSPYRRDEFSVVSALDIDPAGPGHPGTRARHRDRAGCRSPRAGSRCAPRRGEDHRQAVE